MELLWGHYLLLVLSAVIIFLTLIQDSKSDGASGALMGGGLNLFSEAKERGVTKIISQITFYCGIFYIVITMLLKMN